jgi:hypothetical protein
MTDEEEVEIPSAQLEAMASNGLIQPTSGQEDHLSFLKMMLWKHFLVNPAQDKRKGIYLQLLKVCRGSLWTYQPTWKTLSKNWEVSFSHYQGKEE